MRAIQNPFAAVVELTEEKHEPRDEERDIRRREHDLRSLVLSRLSKRFHESLGVFEVLDYVEEEDLIELREVDRKAFGIPFPLVELDVRGLGFTNELINPDNSPCLVGHLVGDVALPATDIEHRGARLHSLDRHGVR